MQSGFNTNEETIAAAAAQSPYLPKHERQLAKARGYCLDHARIPPETDAVGLVVET
jgi:hypothetical protein